MRSSTGCSLIALERHASEQIIHIPPLPGDFCFHKEDILHVSGNERELQQFCEIYHAVAVDIHTA
ncbi:MAG: hypothetical protein HQM12_03815 [SAR324 cluster bacterium]|nr:hypothetical protein [SAR324 cluster bacterium]